MLTVAVSVSRLFRLCAGFETEVLFFVATGGGAFVVLLCMAAASGTLDGFGMLLQDISCSGSSVDGEIGVGFELWWVASVFLNFDQRYSSLRRLAVNCFLQSCLCLFPDVVRGIVRGLMKATTGTST